MSSAVKAFKFPKDTFSADIERKEREIAPRLVTDPPGGQEYEVIVPDTLDLAERCALAVNCLSQFETDLECSGYWHASFGANPPFMSMSSNLDIGKTVEALPQARTASGSTQALEVEKALMLRVLAQSWDDGVFYVAPAEGRPWIGPASAERANMCIIGRMLRGLLCWHEYNGNPLWMEQAHKIYRTIRDKLVRYEEDGNAFFSPPGSGWGYLPKTGYPPDQPKYGDSRAARSSHAAILGYNVLGVSKYAAVTGDQEALELAGKMVNSLRTSAFWERGWGFIEIPGVSAIDRGHFAGHGNTNLITLRGILEYADAANDADAKELVRSAYELFRNYGIPDIGYFQEDFSSANGEGCCAASMVILAVRLSQSGVGDYWEDVEHYVRNQLVEWQLTDRAQLERITAAGEPRQANAPAETDEGVIERAIGGFSANPFVTDYPRPRFNMGAGCCGQNGPQALYQAWEAIVQSTGDGAAQINLLLNRAAAQLDLDSYLPYEGKAVIRNKTARNVSVRIPNWVEKSAVRCHIDTKPLSTIWLNNYLVFQNLKPQAEIVIEFPVVERTLRKTQGVTGTTYTIQMRGNTVVDISPRDELKTPRIAEGALVISRPAHLTVAGLREKDVRVSVETDNSEIRGILLAYQDHWDHVVAWYNPGFPSIGIHRVGAGFEDLVSRADSPYGTSAPKLGPQIRLEAQIKGNEVELTVTDGEKTFHTEGLIPDFPEVPGGIGVSVSDHINEPVHYRNFRATSPKGRVIFEDRFDKDDLNRWQGATEQCNYLFYQREQLRRDEAPLVKKRRFVPHHVIKA